MASDNDPDLKIEFGSDPAGAAHKLTEYINSTRSERTPVGRMEAVVSAMTVLALDYPVVAMAVSAYLMHYLNTQQQITLLRCFEDRL